MSNPTPLSHSGSSPLPHEHGGSMKNAQSCRGLSAIAPPLIIAGGGLAMLWLLEKQTHVLSRSAHNAHDWAEETYHDAYDTAEDWLDDAADWTQHHAHDLRKDMRKRAHEARHWTEKAADRASGKMKHWRHGMQDDLVSAGAKAAGITGLLKAIGGGQLSTGGVRAAKAVAAKKMAEYAASAGKAAARHPAVLAKAAKARSTGKESAQRLRDAYHVLRGGREALPSRHHYTRDSAIAGGLAAVGLGIAAAYFFGGSRGAQRRRDVRLRAQAARHQASDMMGHVAHDVSERAQHLYNRVGGRIGGVERNATINDEQLVSQVRRAVLGALPESDLVNLSVAAHDGHVTLIGHFNDPDRDAACRAAEHVPGVLGVEIQTPETAGHNP